MSLFKYFEKRAKDGLPDPNGPLPARVPLDKSVVQPTERYPGAREISAELAGRIRGPYNR